MVYVGTQAGDELAFDASYPEGTEPAPVWSFTTGAAILSSPAVANGLVFVTSEDNNVYALNASTGSKVWEFGTSSPIDSSPAVVNGVVYVDNGTLYALNASGGGQIWADSGLEGASSPTVAGGTIYIGSYNGNVYALAATSGTQQWAYSTGAAEVSEVGDAPVVANGVVYVGSDNDDLYALEAQNGADLWTYTSGSDLLLSPAVVNGTVYVGLGGQAASFGLAAG